MAEGWLLYCREDYEKNRWFAGELIARGSGLGLDIRLLIAGEEDILRLSPPAFAVNRTRDWRLAAALEKRGCRVFNPSETARIGNDKFESHALAGRLGLPQVEYAASENKPERLAAQPLGYPVVLKNPYGHGGNEVFLARDEAELLALAAALPCERVLLEKLCGRPGVDVRAYVLGGEILASVRRESAGGFRANLSLGGSASYYDLNDAERELVARVAAALPMDYAGVDFILDEAGHFLLNEIEDAVGARALYRLGGVDVIHFLLQYVCGELCKADNQNNR